MVPTLMEIPWRKRWASNWLKHQLNPRRVVVSFGSLFGDLIWLVEMLKPIDTIQIYDWQDACFCVCQVVYYLIIFRKMGQKEVLTELCWFLKTVLLGFESLNLGKCHSLLETPKTNLGRLQLCCPVESTSYLLNLKIE